MSPSEKFAVILAAAGRSTRFGDPSRKKIFADLDGRAVWLRALDPFLNREDVGRIVLVVHADDLAILQTRFESHLALHGIVVVEGGAERSDSIAAALTEIGEVCKYVAIHDAARPCLTAELVTAVFAAAREHGAALPAVPLADTIKRVGPDRKTLETIPRAGLFGAQTPQVFHRDLILRAYQGRAALGASAGVTDDATLVEALGHPCYVVEGSPMNLKITTEADLRLASAILSSQRERC